MDVLTEAAFHHMNHPGTAKQTFKQRYLVQGVHRRKRSIYNTNKVSRYWKILACSFYLCYFISRYLYTLYIYVDFYTLNTEKDDISDREYEHISINKLALDCGGSCKQFSGKVKLFNGL